MLTHRPRPLIGMEGTTFHLLDATPAEAHTTAREAAGGNDVRLGGGPSVVRDFVAARLVDHMHVVKVPVILGRRVRLWDGLESLEPKTGRDVSSEFGSPKPAVSSTPPVTQIDWGQS